MTAKVTLPSVATLDKLDRLDAAAEEANGPGKHGISDRLRGIGRMNDYRDALCEHGASLRSAARMLVELMGKLPRCDHYEATEGHCRRIATREQRGGASDDFNRLYWCDEHSEGKSDTDDTDWADLVRRADG